MQRRVNRKEGRGEEWEETDRDRERDRQRDRQRDTCIHPHTDTRAFSHILSLFFSLSFPPSLTRGRAHTHTNTHTHTHRQTDTLTHTHYTTPMYSHSEVVNEALPPRGALQEVVDLDLQGDPLGVLVAIVVVQQTVHLGDHGFELGPRGLRSHALGSVRHLLLRRHLDGDRRRLSVHIGQLHPIARRRSIRRRHSWRERRSERVGEAPGERFKVIET